MENLHDDISMSLRPTCFVASDVTELGRHAAVFLYISIVCDQAFDLSCRLAFLNGKQASI